MKMLFDTNVLIDAICERNNNYKSSQELIYKVVNKEIDGYISAKQITDIYYILRKYCGEAERRKIIKTISNTFEILPLLPSFTNYCLNSKINDYEDAILDEQAKVNMISVIVTNNTKDFSDSKTLVLRPEDACIFNPIYERESRV